VREILFVAGETSGDINAAGVARELTAANAGFVMVGVGGDRMADAGVHLIEHVHQLAVMGFGGILKQLPRHWALLNAIKARLYSGRVALVILIDYGGFNLHVASAAHAARIPVLYYITPQVWASRAGRIKDIAASVTRAAVIFQFEEALLTAHGIDAVFVGNPLLERALTLPSRTEARAALEINQGRKLLALFPGSRNQEIERNLEPFVEAATLAQSRDPTLDVRVSAASGVSLDPRSMPFPTVRASSWTLLRAADVALCKSGTTTLEAAVAGCPFVIGYRASGIDYAIASRIVTVADIGMVNLVAGRRIVPEFVQDDLDPVRVAAELVDLLDASSPKRAAMLSGLAEVRAKLGTPGASKRVAAMAIELARRSSSRA
jgi:lipid-A-disaccharide synthase